MTALEIEPHAGMKSPGKLIAGLLIGGLVGAATLLLVAPKSGQDTRKYIQTKAIELRDKSTAAVENVSGQVGSKAGQIKTSLSSKTMELTQKGKQMLARQLDSLSAAARNGSLSLQGKSD